MKHGVVFYEPSVTGYRLYYLPPDKSPAYQITLAVEMPFRKAATIAHGLNRCIFEQNMDEMQVIPFVRDYFTKYGAAQYVVCSEARP